MNCANFQCFFFFFCFLNRNIFFFSFKKKKKRIWSTLPLPSWLLILPSYMSTAPHGHMLLRSFSAAWLFSEQIWNCCSCGFLQINFVMVLKKRNQNALLHYAFLIKENYRKNRQHQQIICGQVLNYIYIHIYINNHLVLIAILLKGNKTFNDCHFWEALGNLYV